MFLMTNVKSFKEHIDTNVIKTERGFDILKAAAVYGSNGSGKSNFITAFDWMKYYVHYSFSDSLKKEEDKEYWDNQFKLNTITENASTTFELSFLIGGAIYRYGYEFNAEEIVREWLYRKVEREILLFSRERQEFEINHESFSEGEKYMDDVNANVLLLSHLAQNNQPVSKLIFSWFSNLNVISGLHEWKHDKVTAKILKNEPGFKNWAALALKYLEITNIEAGEKDGEVITYHNKYDENNLLIEAVPFTAWEESEGTKKLINILGPIYDTLRNSRVLLIDEFDCKLHPNLSKKLIDFFQKFNKRNAQIIFTGNDVNLLDKDLWRRDQIWFVEKDQFGASELFSLSEFSSKTVRGNSAIDKKYLNNEFGAAETMEITDNLIDLLYGPEKK